MKNKYWVSYKIPNEIKDLEGGFYVYAFNINEITLRRLSPQKTNEN
jgi:hypothetical protein